MKIYLDGADLDQMASFSSDPLIEGMTTNPTLMKKAGITDYRTFALEVAARVPSKPVSFEVLADDERGMMAQADIISTFHPQAWIKIPITNTEGKSCVGVVNALRQHRVNVTAVMTQRQIEALSTLPPAPRIISVFAGRIADTQVDPTPIVRYAVVRHYWQKSVEILWASPRQVYDVMLADKAGAHIITLTAELIAKLKLCGKNLDDYSLETVRQFNIDGKGITL